MLWFAPIESKHPMIPFDKIIGEANKHMVSCHVTDFGNYGIAVFDDVNSAFQAMQSSEKEYIIGTLDHPNEIHELLWIKISSENITLSSAKKWLNGMITTMSPKNTTYCEEEILHCNLYEGY